MLVLTRQPRPPNADRRQTGDGEDRLLLCNSGEQPLTITLQPGEVLGAFEIVQVRGNKVRVGCEFPRELTVLRAECPIEIGQNQAQGSPATRR